MRMTRPVLPGPFDGDKIQFHVHNTDVMCVLRHQMNPQMNHWSQTKLFFKKVIPKNQVVVVVGVVHNLTALSSICTKIVVRKWYGGCLNQDVWQRKLLPKESLNRCIWTGMGVLLREKLKMEILTCMVSFSLKVVNSGASRVVRIVLGKQPELENHVGVGGYDYPAFIPLNIKNGAYALLKRDTFTDGSVKCTMTSMTASEPVVSLAVSPFSKDSGNKYVFPPTLRAFSDWWVRLLLEEILWDKKYDMDLYRCKDVLSIFNLVEIHSVQRFDVLRIYAEVLLLLDSLVHGCGDHFGIQCLKKSCQGFNANKFINACLLQVLVIVYGFSVLRIHVEALLLSD
ncbi:hypothetical protein Tco_1058700 [Tanacetum coccineum]|uniref:Uncharacterized protein n=1 Tax=Tanacetum coccineum TaxID=301880 RepID=A0ABQ5H9G9_9ASTR